MEMLTAALAVLCALLTLVLLIQRPSIWPVLLALVVAWGICMAAFRYQLRRWLSRWVRGDNFEKSKTKFSLSSSHSRRLCCPAKRCCGTTSSSVPVCWAGRIC